MRLRRLTKKEYILSGLAVLVALLPLATSELHRTDAIAYLPQSVIVDVNIQDMPAFETMFQLVGTN